MQAFLLGISNGAVCIAYCAPVLLPYLLGEGAGIRSNAYLVARFLAGRLLGYLLFGVLAWAVGRIVLPESLLWREAVIGGADMVLAALLVLYGFFHVGGGCAAERAERRLGKFGERWPALMPAALGLFTGLNFCPPFLLAFGNAAAEANLLKTLMFFFLFFLGTSVFFVPFPLVGAARRAKVLATVGKMAAGIMGVYYFYTGLMLAIGVIVRA